MSQHSTTKKPNWQSAAFNKTAYNAANIVANDMGWVDSRTGEVLVACRGLASKGQGGSDAATLPTFTIVLPKAATYGAGKILRFTINSSEVVEVTGTPQVSFTLAGATAGRTADYVASKSSGNKLVFEYTVVAGDVTTNSGQIVGVTSPLTKNGGTVKDANTDVAVAYTVGSVTGILVG